MVFEEAQARVAELTAGRILVGHSIKNDLTALLLSHPRGLVRATARCVSGGGEEERAGLKVGKGVSGRSAGVAAAAPRSC